MSKILTFGEILLRMSPTLGGEWISSATIPTFIGGAELNVATALAGWGVPVAVCTALPINSLSTDIETYIQNKKIETSAIKKSGDRIGIYYLPQGADLKNDGVIYDRAYSSFFDLKVGDIDWDTVFNGVSIFHITAISPAINQNLADLCMEAVSVAKSKGITVSIDLNYRSKLWKYGKEPIDIMPQIVEYCDLIMGNIWAANKLLGIRIDDEVAINKANKEEYLNQANETSASIISIFKNCKFVANTFRFSYQEIGIEYYTTWYQDGNLYQSPYFTRTEVIDQIGSGDCFMGGLLYGLYNKKTPQEIIDFASSAAIGKLNELGDATSQTKEKVIEILNTSKL